MEEEIRAYSGAYTPVSLCEERASFHTRNDVLNCPDWSQSLQS